MSSIGSSANRSLISGEEARAYSLQAVPPQPFGKYTLIGKLGHGGMAEVLLAVMGGKAGFRKLVVLKRIHGMLEVEPGLIDMFLDEARLAAQLDHPHCVQTLEVGDVGGQHFLAMEYLDGQGLDRLLRSSAQSGNLLPPAIAVRMIADALEGLGYAHELAGYDGRPLGVVHRDVSPQNIFVSYNGVVKLLDFGIAKASSNVVETRTGVVKGKYAYIAPEQALGQTVDARADVWSMGVVLWECLTSRRLFKSVNELATLQETLQGEIKLPSTFNPEIPPELDAIVMGALQRDVGHRYQSAAQFKDALEDWLSDQRGAPGRRAIAALMKERFEEVQRLHKEKLTACLAAVEVGPSSIQKLVDAGDASFSDPSGQFSNMTPSSARLIAPPSVTPTPMPGLAGMSIPEPPRVPSATAAGARPPEQDRGRALAWKLVAIAGLAVIAVLIAIVIPRGEQPETATPIATAGDGTVGAPAAAAVPAPAAAAAPAPDVAVAPVAVATDVAVAPATDTAVVPATDEVAATGEPGDRSGRRGRRAPRTETATAAPEPAPPATEDGFLTLATSPWTTVTLDGRTLGDTPLMRERLPAGRHTLRLTNPEAGISETYVVEITAGETTTRRLGLR